MIAHVDFGGQGRGRGPSSPQMRISQQRTQIAERTVVLSTWVRLDFLPHFWKATDPTFLKDPEQFRKFSWHLKMVLLPRTRTIEAYGVSLGSAVRKPFAEISSLAI